MDYIAFVLSIWILFGGRKKPSVVKPLYAPMAPRWTAGLYSMTKPFSDRALNVVFWCSIGIILYLFMRTLP